MSYYPVLIDLRGKKVLVVGGGNVARRKIDSLIEYGADVHVISKELTPELQQYRDEGKVTFIAQEFSEDSLQDTFLTIAATSDPQLNHKISDMAKKRGVLVNAVDQPSDCSFIVPSILKRGDLLIAVSTSGKSPALAKRIRQRLASRFGNEYGSFLQMMGKIREEVLLRGSSQDTNSLIFHKLVDSPILNALRDKDFGKIAATLSEILKKPVTVEDVKDYLKAV